MADNLFIVTKKQRSMIDDAFCGIRQQLSAKDGSPLDPDRVIEELQATSEPVSNPSYPNFRFHDQFYIDVPRSYNHDSQLNLLIADKKSGKLTYLDRRVMDMDFSKATNKLMPSKRYLVKLFHVTRRESSIGCLEFIASQKLILVGAQGLSLVFQQKRNRLPKESNIISYDLEDALLKDNDGKSFVPRLVHSFSGTDNSSHRQEQWMLYLVDFGKYLSMEGAPTYLLCYDR